MSTESGQTTTVKIFNQTYNLRSGDDPEYVKRLARFVDERMMEVLELTPTVDSLKVAVLAALNIADEYFTTTQRLEALEESVCETSEKLVARMDPFLGAGPP